MVKFVLRTRN